MNISQEIPSVAAEKASDPARQKSPPSEELQKKLRFFQSVLDNGILDKAWTNEIKDMKKSVIKAFVSEVHHNRIYQQTRTRRGGQQQLLWATCLPGGKMITSSTKDGLIEKIYKYYAEQMGQRSTKLKNLFPAYIEWKSMERIKGKTLQEYVRLWERYYKDDEIAEQDVRTLTHKDWTKFLQRITIKNQLTEKGLKQVRIVASEMMRFCVEEDILPYDPLGKTDYKRMPCVEEAAYTNVKATPFTDKEVNAIVQWAMEELKMPGVRPLYSFAIIFNLHMGLRYAELCGLRWEDVDWENETIYVNGQATLQVKMNDNLTFTNEGRQRVSHMKSHEKPRLLPLPSDAVLMLKEIQKLGLSEEYVFPEGSFRYHTYNDKIKKAAEAIGLDPKKYHTHCLRATAATNTYNACYDIKQVQALLGHTTPEMTSKYVRDWRGVDVLRNTMEKSSSMVAQKLG